MIFRLNQFLLLTVIVLSVLQDALWLAFLLSALYTFYYGAVWLPLLAIAIDSYYGAFSSVPIFSVITLVWFLISELLKLRLRITNYV